MRKLTLGAVIIGGALLASLPFRRFAPVEDASDGLLEQASGPTQSELSGTSLEMLVEEVSAEAPIVFSSESSFQRPAVSPPKPHTPLTYEDLAVPITENPIYQKKFNATVEVNQALQERRLKEQREHDPLQGNHAALLSETRQRFSNHPIATSLDPGSSQPGMIPPGPSRNASATAKVERSILQNPESDQLVSDSHSELRREANANGKLASSVRSPEASHDPISQPPVLPNGEESMRQRHWIRQPSK